MNSRRFLELVFVIFLFLGAVPKILNYQGKLTGSSGVGVSDTLDMVFRLYNTESGGTPLWVEPHTGTNAVIVRNGLFSVELGSIVQFPDSVNFSEQYWLEVTVDGETFSPRERLVAVPYSLRARTVERYDNVTIGVNESDELYVKPGGIGSNEIADSSITSADLAPGVAIAGTGASFKIAFWTDVGTIGFDSTFHWDITNRRLGIGTTSPAERLHVVGTILAEDPSYPDNISYITSNGTNSQIGGGLMVGGDIDINMNSEFGGWTITGVDGDGDDLSFRYTGTAPVVVIEGVSPIVPYIYVKDDGNIGLYTNDPQARLDVRGQMYSRLYEIPWPSR